MLYEKINNLEKHIKETETVTQKNMQRMNDRIGKIDLNYMDIFEHLGERLKYLEKSMKNYGKMGTRMQTWQLEFKEGMTDEINKKLEELLVAKDVKPGVWRKMANVLHRENKNKNLENMQKSMEKMHEDVNELTNEIKWLKETKMQEKVNELKEMIKELDEDEVSLPDDDKENRDAAVDLYSNNGAPKGSDIDEVHQSSPSPVTTDPPPYSGLNMEEVVAAHWKRRNIDPKDRPYQTEIKNRYIV